MSRSLHTWYSLPDLDLLASRGSVLEGDLNLEHLHRLRELLQSADGSLRGRMEFRHHAAGCLLTEVEFEASLKLACQRCLETMDFGVHARVSYGLVETDSMRVILPEDCESYVLGDDRFCPARLIEDEVIVSLPLVPRHADKQKCGRLARTLDELNSEAGGASRASVVSADP